MKDSLSKFSAEIAVIQKASEAARVAANEKIEANPGMWYPCGFSWVRIKPSRGQMVKALKELDLGHKDEFNGGYVVYNPSGNYTQWMDAKMAGSRAYAEVLNKYFIETGSNCRAAAQQRED